MSRLLHFHLFHLTLQLRACHLICHYNWRECHVICHCCYFRLSYILGDPGAVSRVDKMSVVKVYCKIETSPWALTLTEPVPEAFELPASDWPEKIFSGQSAKRSSRVTLMFSYTT